MSERVTGQVAWKTTEDSNQEGGGQDSLFMRLQEGSNPVRIISEKPWITWIHWMPDVNGQKVKVRSAQSPDCPAQIKADAAPTKELRYDWSAQSKWLVQVIDRTDGKFKILEFSKQVRNGIGDLVHSKAWGPIYKYDIDIKKVKGGQPVYTVMPLEKKSLTKEEKVLAKEFVMKETKDGTPLMEALTRPWTVQEVEDKLAGKVKEKQAQAQQTSPAAASATAFDDAAVETSDDSDEPPFDTNFTPPAAKEEASKSDDTAAIDTSFLDDV